MSDKNVGIPKTPITIGGDPKDRQIAGFVAEALKSQLMPILNSLSEQMAALDVIQDDVVKRLEKLEKRNNIVVTHKLDKEILNVIKSASKKTA